MVAVLFLYEDLFLGLQALVCSGFKLCLAFTDSHTERRGRLNTAAWSVFVKEIYGTKIKEGVNVQTTIEEKLPKKTLSNK